jgi:hypothetical protein
MLENVKVRADSVFGLRQTTFDKSYLDFSDEQIELCPRGPKWNDRLRRRREALAPFSNQNLLDGRIRTEDSEYWIKVDPDQKIVVHWEIYQE